MDTLNPNQMPPLQMYGGPEKKPVGPIIAVVVILALIVIGGLYFLKERSSQRVYIPVEQEQSDISDPLGSSDESSPVDTSTETDMGDSENPEAGPLE